MAIIIDKRPKLQYKNIVKATICCLIILSISLCLWFIPELDIDYVRSPKSSEFMSLILVGSWIFIVIFSVILLFCMEDIIKDLIKRYG